jgi:opacity protein-like surface antigen
MISRKLSIVMTAALLAAGAAAAHAADDIVVTETKTTETTTVEADAKVFGGKVPYFMAGGVWGIANDSHFEGDLSDSGGYDLRGGYGVHEMVDLEIQWQSLLSFSRDSVDPITGNNDPAVEARMLSFNGRLSPLAGRFQPYALLGMGWYNVQADRSNNQEHKSSFAMRFGVGVATFFTERFGFNLEAGYILPLSGDLAGGDSFQLIPITASFFYCFK